MNFSKEEQETMIINYLIMSRLYLIYCVNDILIQKHNLLLDEPTVYHADINKECDVIIRNVLVTECAKDLALDHSIMKEVIENLNLAEYFK
jgi:hypothetical protein